MSEVNAVDAKEYFEPSPQRGLIEQAALIVALTNNRESAARADFAHPRMNEIVAILQQIRGSPRSGDARPTGATPQSIEGAERTVSSGSATPAR